MKQLDSILKILPTDIRGAIKGLSTSIIDRIEEIRIRADQPLLIMCNDMFFVRADGKTNIAQTGAYIITVEDCATLFRNITGYSMYAVEQQLAQCYVTIEGGIRIGVAGSAVYDEGGNIRLVKDCMSFNIRIPREVKGCATEVMRYIATPSKIKNTLIISPPRAGKTTMLRDIARIVSNGFNSMPKNVCIVDERGEIAACINGIAQFDVGIRTDILDGCVKSQGMTRMIRTMAPDVIITDELGSASDATAIAEAANSGVVVIASAHGFNINNALERPELANILQMGFFERYIILGNSNGPGTLLNVYDTNMKMLYSRINQGKVSI